MQSIVLLMVEQVNGIESGEPFASEFVNEDSDLHSRLKLRECVGGRCVVVAASSMLST